MSSFQTIKAIIIFDTDGEVIFSKYYQPLAYDLTESATSWAKNTYSLIRKSTPGNLNNEIVISSSGHICVYRTIVDLIFAVIGNPEENELLISHFLESFFDVMSIVLKKSMEKKTLLDNMDSLFVVIDEMCDEGIILDCDSADVAERAASHKEEIPLTEQTVAQVIQTAKEQIKWSLLK
ncbi:hypothetical protein ACOME3_007496 [Neoechinorhynchus agilis]